MYTAGVINYYAKKYPGKEPGQVFQVRKQDQNFFIARLKIG
jgi:hypothetical protein